MTNRPKANIDYNPIPDSPGFFSHGFIAYRNRVSGWQAVGYVGPSCDAHVITDVPGFNR